MSLQDSEVALDFDTGPKLKSPEDFQGFAGFGSVRWPKKGVLSTLFTGFQSKRPQCNKITFSPGGGLWGPKLGPQIGPKGFPRGLFFFYLPPRPFLKNLGGTFLGLSGGAKSVQRELSNDYTL